MATYVYSYSRYGKGEMIGKYADGYIYDLRGRSTESSSNIIGVTTGNYLRISRGHEYRYTDITVSGNVAYKNKNYYLVAKNNVIYSSNNVELAEYEGNAAAALATYAALQFTRSDCQATEKVNGSYSTQSYNPDSHSRTSSFGCSTWLIFAVLTIIAAYYGFISEFAYEYYTIIHIAIPAIVILGIIIKRAFKDEEYQYPFLRSLGNFMVGILVGFVIIFVIGSHDIIMHSIMGESRGYIINVDIAYSICIFETGIISTMLGAKRKA